MKLENGRGFGGGFVPDRTGREGWRMTGSAFQSDRRCETKGLKNRRGLKVRAVLDWTRVELGFCPFQKKTESEYYHY